MKSISQTYRQGQLFIENVAIEKIAHTVKTPFYVYSQSEIERSYRAYDEALAAIPHQICFALKANSNLAVARVLSRLGAGADIVSAGEFHRAILAGFSANKIIFSGVGKTKYELELALKKGIRLINVESTEELKALNEVATALKIKAPFSLRVNPDVRAGGHPHISTGTPHNKFGVYHKNIFPLYKWAFRQPYLLPSGIQCHIGSQITQVKPYERALRVLGDLHASLEKIGIHLEVIDIGGGLGVDYNNDQPKHPRDLANVLLPYLRNRNVTLFLEPGRSLVAQAGVLVTQVLYRKDAGHKHFIIVDAAMNDLARPALYDAYHEIVPVRKRAAKLISADVVGPVCESGDYLAKGRMLPYPRQGDYLAVLSAGAYGFSMSSQYNARPRVPEILVHDDQFDVIRERETFDDLIKGERIPEHLSLS